jgi:large subunit ribosomal protein L17
MMANMACSLIEHKRIETTVTKAKVLKRYVEPLITRSKEDSTASRRATFRRLRQKEAVTELFREIGPKVADRPGGYCRILRTGFRAGDGAEMCFIELVDYNENMLQDSSTAKKKARRSRRGGAKKAAGAVAAAAGSVADKAADVAEEVKDKASEVVEDVKEAAEDAVEAAKDVAEDIKDAVTGDDDDKKDEDKKEK